MNPIDWSFNLRQAIISVVVIVVAFGIALMAVAIRRRSSPKLPRFVSQPIHAPGNTLNREHSKNTNQEPYKARTGNSINHFNQEIDDKRSN
jgi:hypothetical protein